MLNFVRLFLVEAFDKGKRQNVELHDSEDLS